MADYSAVDRYSKIAAELENLPPNSHKKPLLEKQLKQAEIDIEENTWELVFRSISRKDLRFLLDYHAPTDEQREEHPEMLYNPDTFPAALIAACCVEPVMTYEDAKMVFDEWSDAEAWSLFDAAWQLCFIKTTPNYATSIWNDPQLRNEMRFCNKVGIPHSVFTGRVVRPGEPMWLDDDQDKAIAYMLLEGELCGQCHTAFREWDADTDAYIVEAKRCLGCEALEMFYSEIPHGQKGIKAWLRKPREEDFDPELFNKPLFKAPKLENVIEQGALL